MATDSKIIMIGETFNDTFGGSIKFIRMIEFCDYNKGIGEVKITTPWGNSYIVNINWNNYYLNTYTNNNYNYSVNIGLFCGQEVTRLDCNVSYEEKIPPLECIEYTTETTCKANGCFWWLNNTCHNVPEGVTSYVDFYIKPYSWYTYGGAVDKILELTSNIGGAISNIFSKITEFEYKGIQILQDQNENVVIIRIFIADTGITTLVHPLLGAVIILLIIEAIVQVIMFIGWPTGTDTIEIKPSDIPDTAEKVLDNTEGAALGNVLDVDEATQKRILNCLKLATTKEQKESCFIVEGINLTSQQAREILLIYQTVTDALGDALSDPEILNDLEYAAEAKRLHDLYDKLMDDLEAGNITAAEAVAESLKLMEEYKKFMSKKSEELKDEECAWEIAGTCIITKKGLKNLVWLGIGTGALILYSGIKK